MSYDYDALVLKISKSRKSAMSAEGDVKISFLQQAIDTFEELSTECPMTPMLWMQYSADMEELLILLTGDSRGAREAQLQLLELAICEFPGSACLHLRHLTVLSLHNDATRFSKAVGTAIQSVGTGSHRNEGEIVAAIYRMDAEYHAKNGNFEHAVQIYVKRASVPMKNVNDGLQVEFQEFCSRYGKRATTDHTQSLEAGRRYEAKTFRSLVTYEDEIDMTMHKQGILVSWQVEFDEINWDLVLKGGKKNNLKYWMGLGDIDTATSFIQYAQFCHKFNPPDVEELKDYEWNGKTLALCVYERGVAECPTVESIWLSYVSYLFRLAKDDDTLVPRLKTASDRSVRNCPYSLSLFQRKLEIMQFMAANGMAIMDPDEVSKTVTDAVKAKFLTSKESCLELHLTGVRILRRHILMSLAQTSQPTKESKDTICYDEAEPLREHQSAPQIDDDKAEELADLVVDIREMYDAIESYVQKQFPLWSAGRSHVCGDRSFAERYLLSPLMESLNGHSDRFSDAQSTIIRCFDRATKLHQPPSPSSFISYIDAFFSNYPLSSPVLVLSRIRQIRELYKKAIKSVGPSKDDWKRSIDYGISLQFLCHKYLEFEENLGSVDSLEGASKVIKRKLAKLKQLHQIITPVPKVVGTKTTPVKSENCEEDSPINVADQGRKRSCEEVSSEKIGKKLKMQDGSEKMPQESTRYEEISKKTDLRVPKQNRKKVMVGNLLYPAHQFTIRVSNLTQATEDMDLVDICRKSFGEVVHAKILREKHRRGTGISKGCGLVQFEEKNSVDRALEASEMLQIHENRVRIEPSHVAAVSLVPPGMHRVNPKGQGKRSKQNEKRSEQRLAKQQTAKSDEPVKPKQTSVTSFLEFRPRGLAKLRK